MEQTVAQRRRPGEPAVARDSGAGEPTELSVLLATLETQVPESVDRDKVLDAGRRLESNMSQKIARSLASNWEVRQFVGGANRSVADIVQEIREKVTNAAMRLVQAPELQAKELEEKGNHTDQHPPGWTPYRHLGICGPYCPCCRALEGETFGACRVCQIFPPERRL